MPITDPSMSLQPWGSSRGAGAAAGDPDLYRELGHATRSRARRLVVEGGGGGAIGTADELALRERPGALGTNSRRAGGSASTRAGEGAWDTLPTVWGTIFWRLRKSMETNTLRTVTAITLPRAKRGKQ